MMQKTTFMVFIMFFLCGTLCCVHADVLSDRTALESILGTNAVTEDFETLAVPLNTAYGIPGVDVLDASSVLVVNTMTVGPGLIIPGVAFSDLVNLSWIGENIWGQPSRSILGWDYDGIPGHTITIDFQNPTPACGLDLSILSVTPFDPDVFTIKVYGADDTGLLYSSPEINIDFFTRIFWGFHDDNGIGKLEVSSTMQDWSAIVDNVTFSAAAVPEPVSSVLFLFGAGYLWTMSVRKKRNNI